MDDLISRQAAIDALGERPMVWVESDYELGARNQYDADVLALETVPSAQPDIIHCKDCTKCQIDNVFHDYWCDGRKVWKDHYCGYAERRTDE